MEKAPKKKVEHMFQTSTLSAYFLHDLSKHFLQTLLWLLFSVTLDYCTTLMLFQFIKESNKYTFIKIKNPQKLLGFDDFA